MAKTIIEQLHDLQSKLITAIGKGLQADECPAGIMKEARELLKDNNISGDFKGQDAGKLDVLGEDISKIQEGFAVVNQ